MIENNSDGYIISCRATPNADSLVVIHDGEDTIDDGIDNGVGHEHDDDEDVDGIDKGES